MKDEKKRLPGLQKKTEDTPPAAATSHSHCHVEKGKRHGLNLTEKELAAKQKAKNGSISSDESTTGQELHKHPTLTVHRGVRRTVEGSVLRIAFGSNRDARRQGYRT